MCTSAASWPATRIDALLGRGGQDVVYWAEHLKLQKAVAPKPLPPHLANDQEFRERLNLQALKELKEWWIPPKRSPDDP